MIILALIFILLGILVKNGKAYNLIAGYNTLSKKEKDSYDIEGIATVFRNSMFGMAVIIVLGFLAAKWFENPQYEIYAVFLSIVTGIPYLLIKANSRKYRK